MSKIPASVVKQLKDHANSIERGKEAQKSFGELAWHWTMNDENPLRVSQREAARLTGVPQSMFSEYGRAYEKTLERPEVSMHDAVGYVKLGANWAAVGEHVAKEFDIKPLTVVDKFNSAPKNKSDEELQLLMRTSHGIAKTRATQNMTSIEEEAKTAVAEAKEMIEAGRRQKAKRKLDPQQTFVDANKKILDAHKLMRQCAALVETGSMYEDQYEILAANVRLLKSAVDEVRIICTTNDVSDFDWDGALSEMIAKTESGE